MRTPKRDKDVSSAVEFQREEAEKRASSGVLCGCML